MLERIKRALPVLALVVALAGLVLPSGVAPVEPRGGYERTSGILISSELGDVPALDVVALASDSADLVTSAIKVGDEWNYAIDSPAPALLSAHTHFEDFLGDEVEGKLFEISGTDTEAVQVLVSEQYGVYQITSGDTGTGVTADLEAFNFGLGWTADQGSLVLEARLHLDTAITTATVCVGFSDDETSVEMPATINVATITTNMTDGVAFCYDTDATTDQWYFIGVDTNVDATGSALTGVAPVADIYQVFRIEVDSAGSVCRGYINGTLVVTLSGCLTNTVALAPGVWVDPNDTAASQVVDVDYLFVSADRD